MAYTEWGKVFALAMKVAKELRAKKPTLSQADAVKQAWKHPDVLKARKEFDEHRAKKSAAPAKKAAAKKK